MKRGVSTLLLLGFVGVAVFGFIAMMHEDGRGHSDCVAATAQATACPMSFSPLSVTFHIDTFKNFSTAIVSSGIFAILAALALFAGAFALYILRVKSVSLGAIDHNIMLSAIASSSVRELHRWLTRLENSPSLSL